MSFPVPYPGPVPPYNNVPINPQYFKPRQWFISAISLGRTTNVTTTTDHDYVIGQLCRLLIPQANGTIQLNEQVAYVLNIPASNQVELDINSLNFNSFKTSTQPTQPQILAIGDINLGNINASGNLNTSTLIPGSYQNISPL